jgi:glutathione S-transferase
VADNKKQQLTIWGRSNSVNVQKVLWCLAELDLGYQRIDAGMQFGKNNEAAYLAMNPNGRVPTLVDGDYVLWESNSVMRYLCMAYGGNSPIYPAQPKARAAVDRWLDWTLSTLQPVDRPVFWALVRTPVEKRDMVADRRGATGEPALHRRRPVHDRRYRTRRLCAPLAGRRGRQQAEIAKSRTLVCAVRGAPRLHAIHRAADDVSFSANRRRHRRRC